MKSSDVVSKSNSNIEGGVHTIKTKKNSIAGIAMANDKNVKDHVHTENKRRAKKMAGCIDTGRGNWGEYFILSSYV